MKNNKEKGITLLILVITIIILLIIAGVSIIALTGENGLISKAKQAKKNMSDAQNFENSTLNSYENYINEGISEKDKSNIKLTADMVAFVPEDSNWDVKNVKEALDYLYNEWEKN